jgi:oligoribonuclease NrnB/cAMP/cGMP phosphodiesterase (DHH superfamily)
MIENKIIVIYHGNCIDGFTAAWVVRLAHGKDESITYHAGFYKDPPPDVKGKKVYIVDFSYKRPIMEQIVADAAEVIHIDHHESAIRDMEGFKSEKFTSFYSPQNTQSGAMLAWHYFFVDTPVPEFIKYVDDRDRWRFRIPHSREVNANIFSYEYTFENWDMIAEQDIEKQILEGTAIERSNAKNVKELMGVVVRRANIAGYNVPLANVPYQYGSDICANLAKNEPFAAYYYDKPTHREFGLRSDHASGINVAEIAEQFGGGGHKTASGFKRTFDEAKEFEV